MQHPSSCFQHPASDSSVQHPTVQPSATSTQRLVSRIQHPAFSSFHTASSIPHLELTLEADIGIRHPAFSFNQPARSIQHSASIVHHSMSHGSSSISGQPQARTNTRSFFGSRVILSIPRASGFRLVTPNFEAAVRFRLRQCSFAFTNIRVYGYSRLRLHAFTTTRAFVNALA